MWVVIGLVLVVMLVVAAACAGWLLVPTLKTFRGPSFEPASADELSVLRAQQTGMVDGGQ
jgi:hypothetical protein